MKNLKMKAKAGVTLVELLVVILIVTILAVGLLPLLKPYIEQSKYAAEALPTLGNIQTKINLYQYEKDKLPCTIETTDNNGVKTETAQDSDAYTWMLDTSKSEGKARIYKLAKDSGIVSGTKTVTEYTESAHLKHFVDVDWQDLLGKRINPSQFSYHVIKGSGAAKYGYAIGIFGDGDGIAKGTGYAILVLVDTQSQIKVIATWERYKPATDETIQFKASSAISDKGNGNDNYCRIPDLALFTGATDASSWSPILDWLKSEGWSFNFDDITTVTQ
ncbi:MAG: type II secretion system protein [Kiritimatiellia bacterium]